jgi:hypothetical protein
MRQIIADGTSTSTDSTMRPICREYPADFEKKSLYKK